MLFTFMAISQRSGTIVLAVYGFVTCIAVCCLSHPCRQTSSTSLSRGVGGSIATGRCGSIATKETPQGGTVARKSPAASRGPPQTVQSMAQPGHSCQALLGTALDRKVVSTGGHSPSSEAWRKPRYPTRGTPVIAVSRVLGIYIYLRSSFTRAATQWTGV